VSLSTNIWVWVAAFLTLCIFSFLYKDNPLYRFAEHLFVGVANGYSIAMTWHLLLKPKLVDPLRANPSLNWWLMIPTILGVLYFTRFIRRLSWMVRLPIAVVMGYSMGVSIPATIETNFLRQIQATILTKTNFASWYAGNLGILWSIILLIGVLSTLAYFFFSVERKGALRPAARLGIIFIMVGFGASFGYTFMARISLLIGRLQFLLRDWLGVIR